MIFTKIKYSKLKTVYESNRGTWDEAIKTCNGINTEKCSEIGGSWGYRPHSKKPWCLLCPNVEPLMFEITTDTCRF